MRKGLIEKYLVKESTFYFGPTFIAGDDDFPTGNILIGDKYKKVDYYNRLTSFDKKWVPDVGDWKWDEFDAASGQESLDVYHDSLRVEKPFRGLNVTSRLFRHMKNEPPKEVPRYLRPLGNDIFPDHDGWGNKADYVQTADDKDTTVNTKDQEAAVDPTNMEYFDKVLINVNKYLKRNKK